jgi:hypothetical protein
MNKIEKLINLEDLFGMSSPNVLNNVAKVDEEYLNTVVLVRF